MAWSKSTSNRASLIHSGRKGSLVYDTGNLQTPESGQYQKPITKKVPRNKKYDKRLKKRKSITQRELPKKKNRTRSYMGQTKSSSPKHRLKSTKASRSNSRPISPAVSLKSRSKAGKSPKSRRSPRSRVPPRSKKKKANVIGEKIEKIEKSEASNTSKENEEETIKNNEDNEQPINNENDNKSNEEEIQSISNKEETSTTNPEETEIKARRPSLTAEQWLILRKIRNVSLPSFGVIGPMIFYLDEVYQVAMDGIEILKWCWEVLVIGFFIEIGVLETPLTSWESFMGAMGMHERMPLFDRLYNALCTSLTAQIFFITILTMTIGFVALMARLYFKIKKKKSVDVIRSESSESSIPSLDHMITTLADDGKLTENDGEAQMKSEEQDTNKEMKSIFEENSDEISDIDVNDMSDDMDDVDDMDNDLSPLNVQEIPYEDGEGMDSGDSF